LVAGRCPKLRADIRAIADAGVAVVLCIYDGDPCEAVVRVVQEIDADGLVIGSHSTCCVYGLGGTAQAICEHPPALVMMASPAQ
jgi:hypothetical protein